MASVLDGLEPKLLWKHFDELRKIPRCSKHEEKAVEYVISVAKDLGLEYKKDEAGNVVVKKPGSKGHEDAPTIVLQGHIDMVCEKNRDKEFDFSKDAIELEIEDDYLTAKGTSLGSDDGMGVCAALAILEDDSLVHGPIEALFTIDEETGLTGAFALSDDLLEGRHMINLDTEEERSLYVGCAGGGESKVYIPVEWSKPDANMKAVELDYTWRGRMP
jgi:dipeptidase D